MVVVNELTNHSLMPTESETFDLAGKSAATIEHAIGDAFSEPFTLSETVRITFVTGAGKLGRQKYDDGAAKAVTSTLRDLGYEEDHSGGAGTFKLQHDTGKNLKTVVVYPQVSGGAEKGVGGMSLESKTESLIPEDSPEYKIAHASMNVFKRMLESKCPSWSQKKGCVAAIEAIKKTLQELDEKLLHGTPLSNSEQDFYDSVSMNSLDEKQACVRELMHKQVDDGDLTTEDKKHLLSQVSERLETIEKEIKTVESEGKNKKGERLKEMKKKATERKEKLAKITSKPPHRLKNEAEIFKLRTEMMPLQEIEDGAKGRLLTLKESQAVSRKDEILEEIGKLEVSCTQGDLNWWHSLRVAYFLRSLGSLVTGSQSGLV